MALARKIFEDSLQTLTEEFPVPAMNMGVDDALLTSLSLARTHGHIFDNAGHIKSVSDMSQMQLDTLVRVGAILEMSDGAYTIDDEFDINKLEEL